MSGLVEVQRVVVIARRDMELPLLETFLQLGAKRWTSVFCNGRGEHSTFTESDQSRVRIEILTSAEIAAQVIQRLDESPFHAHSIVAFTDTVQVSDKRKVF